MSLFLSRDELKTDRDRINAGMILGPGGVWRWPVVYVMEYVLDGKALGCKVGFSKNVEQRLNHIQYLFRCNEQKVIRLVAAYETRDYRIAERRAHQALAKINGRCWEWFRVSAEEACNAVQQAIREAESR